MNTKEIAKMTVKGLKVETLVKRMNIKHIKGYYYGYDYACIKMGNRRIEVASELLLAVARQLGGDIKLCVIGKNGEYAKVNGQTVMKVTDPLAGVIDELIG